MENHVGNHKESSSILSVYRMEQLLTHLSPLQGLAHRLKLAGAVSTRHPAGVYRRGKRNWHSQGGFQLLDQLGLGLRRPIVHPFLAALRTVSSSGIHGCSDTLPVAGK